MILPARIRLVVFLCSLLAPQAARAGNAVPTLLEAAWQVESCAQHHEITRRRQRFERLCDIARTQVSLADAPRKRAARLLAVLHREVLTGPFQAEAWSVGATLDSGRHNCLTATILYIELCRRFELPISAVSTPGHLACRLEGPTPLLIEATCARWFEIAPPAYKPEEQARGELVSSARWFESTRDNRAYRVETAHAGRVLTDGQVLAKVHYNRALVLLGESRFEPAVACLRTSRRLDPLDVAAVENEVAALHNWALALADEGYFNEAALRIAQGLALEPESPLLRAGAKHLHATRLTPPGS